MTNIRHSGEIIREEIAASTDANNSKVTEHLKRARVLRAGLYKAKFDVADIDVLKRADRDIKDIS